MKISKKSLIVSVISVALILLIIIFYPHNCLLFGETVFCESIAQDLDQYFYLVMNPTRHLTETMGNTNCLDDADTEKSGFLNGQYSLGLDDGWMCYPELYSISLNATSDIQLMLECVDLYEKREKEMKITNEILCERLGIPQCNAVEIISFPEFQKKYCDFW